MIRARSSVLLAFVLIACDSTAPRSITGNWEGSAIASNSLFVFSLDLVDAAGTITGSAGILGTGDNCANATFDITGTRTGSAVTLTFTCTNYTPFTFEAELSRDGRTLQGTLNGSGFVEIGLDLSKGS